jgi:hypothetical protein
MNIKKPHVYRIELEKTQIELEKDFLRTFDQMPAMRPWQVKQSLHFMP